MAYLYDPQLRQVAGHRRRPRAFTLVELLVVIGIIALLISILLPSLSKAMRMARAVACQSNLRTIAMWGMQYANDNKGVLPVIGDSPANSATSMYYWPISDTDWTDKSRPAGLFKGWGTASGSVLHCPEAVAALTPMRASQRGTTYGLNPYLGGRRSFTSPTAQILPPPKTKLLSAKVYWFGDSRATYNNGWYFETLLAIPATNNFAQLNWPWNWDSSSVGGIKADGHPNRVNYFVFGDGHCEGLSQQEFVNLTDVQRKKFCGYPF